VKKKKTKAKYRLHDWKEYNRSLVRRGSLTLWVSDEVLMAWHNHAQTGKRGHPRDYTDTVITAVFRIKAIFGDRVLARSFAGGAAEILVRYLISLRGNK
jgi:hypothetical protein